MRLTDRPGRDVPICLAIAAGLAYLFRPVFASDGLHYQPVTCLSNVKQSVLGLLIYAGDEDDRLPPRDLWMDATLPYTKTESVWHYPSVLKAACGYAFNGALSRAKTPAEPQTVPLIYDSVNPIRNASDLLASLPLPGRHKGRNTVGYADGHAESVPARPVVH